MKLESVNIENFRSIENVTLESCGGFNVIVGKNNAGKSNILMSINSFFQCLSGGSPIVLTPPHSDKIDHHANRQEQSIRISILFQMSLAERDELIQNIISESPQVKNTLEGLNVDLRLAITLEIVTEPKPFGYIQKIILCNSSLPISQENTIRTIFEMNITAAKELADKEQKARNLRESARELQEAARRISRGMNENEWMAFKSLRSESYPKSRLVRTIGSIEGMSIEEILEASDSPKEFQLSVSTIAQRMEEDAKRVQMETMKHHIESFSGQEDSIPTYVINLIQQIGKMKVLYLTERRQQIGRQEATKLLDLKITRGGPEKLRAIQEIVSSLLGVDIDVFQATQTSQREEPEAELDVDQFLVQVNGAGIREALRLILDYELNHPDILLVEEPEIHLHPALETSMMRYLKAIGQHCQIFITTHSTNFLDAAEMRNVYLASIKSSTTLQLISVEEAEESIPRELGIRLSSLFMFDRLIFVEGPTDEDVFRELASTLKINFAQAGVGFVPMGGVRNFTHFATEATMNFLSKRRVGLFFILDRDEREEAEIQKLTAKLGDNARLKVLAKRELENYLLHPRAVARFIEMKHHLGGDREYAIDDISVIRQAIEECTEKLKNVAIERRTVKAACYPIYPNTVQVLTLGSSTPLLDRIKDEYTRQREHLDQLEKELHEIVRIQTEQVEGNWTTKKQDLVPGDILLDEVCKIFNTRFNKEKDSARLATLLNENEIDVELKSVLKSIIEYTPNN